MIAPCQAIPTCQYFTWHISGLHLQASCPSHNTRLNSAGFQSLPHACEGTITLLSNLVLPRRWSRGKGVTLRLWYWELCLPFHLTAILIKATFWNKVLHSHHLQQCCTQQIVLFQLCDIFLLLNSHGFPRNPYCYIFKDVQEARDGYVQPCRMVGHRWA